MSSSTLWEKVLILKLKLREVGLHFTSLLLLVIWNLYIEKKMHTKLWYYHFLNEFVRNLGNHEIGKFLIEKGADINAKENNEETALHRSAFHGNWLKRKKCKQNKNIDLIWNSGSASAAQLLLENGANVGIKDKYGQTALGYLLKHQKF